VSNLSLFLLGLSWSLWWEKRTDADLLREEQEWKENIKRQRSFIKHRRIIEKHVAKMTQFDDDKHEGDGKTGLHERFHRNNSENNQMNPSDQLNDRRDLQRRRTLIEENGFDCNEENGYEYDTSVDSSDENHHASNTSFATKERTHLLNNQVKHIANGGFKANPGNRNNYSHNHHNRRHNFMANRRHGVLNQSFSVEKLSFSEYQARIDSMEEQKQHQHEINHQEYRHNEHTRNPTLLSSFTVQEIEPDDLISSDDDRLCSPQPGVKMFSSVESVSSSQSQELLSPKKDAVYVAAGSFSKFQINFGSDTHDYDHHHQRQEQSFLIDNSN
jgi:hypothetical protein